VLADQDSARRLPAEIVSAVVAKASSLDGELIALRRELHANPELGREEVRTTAVVAGLLSGAGLSPVLLEGSGLICDVGSGSPVVALRADLDALPIEDETTVAYRSTVPGVSHACGHDVHTAVVLGAGLVLADLVRRGLIDGGVRLIFQPAEELTPGGALDVVAAGGLGDVRRIFAVHCDPRADVGTVGLREGPITGSADEVRVRLTGPGGHTSRPHLTADLVYALAAVVTGVPALLSRRVDPRTGISVVWGNVHAGSAANAIPRAGEARGTVRTLDAQAWERAPLVVADAIRAVAAPFGVGVDVDYRRGVPPVVNDAACTAMLGLVAADVLGVDSVTETEQSLGGEDFAWYLDRVPGALARLGVRGPGEEGTHDLHQGNFDVDERAVAVGVRLLAGTAAAAVLSA
jgi:amidohydrolase